MAQPASFVPTRSDDRQTTPTAGTRPEAIKSPAARKRRRKGDAPIEPLEVDVQEDQIIRDGGDLKELETLFSLWRSAGRNVNLWDWLEGFREAVTHFDQADETHDPPVDVDKAADSPETPKRPNSRGKTDEPVEDEAEDEDDKEKEKENDGIDEDTQDRLHATFIRFCEEARMMGLVRARGGRTAKRADEVVKSINFI